MFEHMKKYRVIVVTGPQRSGTTIAAHCIARDTDFAYIDEDDLRWVGPSMNDESRMLQLIVQMEKIVIQAPACAHIAHVMGAWRDVAIVFMIRDIKDIVKSQNRIGWNCEGDEFKKYDPRLRLPTIAATKYAFWKWQRAFVKNPIELEYNSLRNHPLWVEHRDRFKPRQWRP